MRARASALVLGSAATGLMAALAASVPTAGASTPPSDPDGSDTVVATSEPTGTYEFGVFTAPDGSFTANFAQAPGRSADETSGVVTYLAPADEDSESVVLFPVSALGAAATSNPVERAELFLAASGTDIEPLANTPTNLGPFPASHFAARVTLADGRRATVYGVLADRARDVAYAFYTDIGDDDNAAATAFVQSFAVVFPEPPVPTVPPTTVATTDPSAPTTAAVPTTSDAVAPTSSAAPTSSTTPAPSTVVEAPDGAVLGFDGRWWITFPPGVTPTFRASTENGFAYSEYLAIDGDDTLVVRVTEVPAGYEWDAEQAPSDAADRVGGEVQESGTVEVDGRPGVRFVFAQDDSDTSGDTVAALVVNGGDQIYAVEFWDGGETSTDAAADFIDSFALA